MVSALYLSVIKFRMLVSTVEFDSIISSIVTFFFSKASSKNAAMLSFIFVSATPVVCVLTHLSFAPFSFLFFSSSVTTADAVAPIATVATSATFAFASLFILFFFFSSSRFRSSLAAASAAAASAATASASAASAASATALAAPASVKAAS